MKSKHLVIISLLFSFQVFATSWTTLGGCKEDEVLSGDGIDTMKKPPVCKKKKDILQKLENECNNENLNSCESLWSWKIGSNEAEIIKMKFLALAEKKCLNKDAWACEEVWRMIANTTYLEKQKKNINKYMERLRTKEDTEKMIKFIKLGCKFGKETGHLKTAYICEMASDDSTKYY